MNKTVKHILFNMFFMVSLLGQFEHMLQLDKYMTEPWHWFLSTIVPFLPHHQWWGTIGMYIMYVILSWEDFTNIATLIYKKSGF